MRPSKHQEKFGSQETRKQKRPDLNFSGFLVFKFIFLHVDQIRVTVWNENLHEAERDRGEIYPDGMQAASPMACAKTWRFWFAPPRCRKRSTA
jgi:hypothetical protein